MSVYEMSMLLCFGASWPLSIAKSLRTRVVAEKSPLFMAVIGFGYLSGIVHKLIYSLDWVLALYVLNLVMVAADLSLYYYYSAKNRKASPS